MQDDLVKALGRLEPAGLRMFELAEKSALIAAGALAALGAAEWVHGPFSWLAVRLTIPSAAAALACAAALEISFGLPARRKRKAMRLLACAAGLPLVANIGAAAWRSLPLFSGTPVLVALAFVFLGVLLWFLDSRDGAAAAIADASALGLGWSVLTLLAEVVFRTIHVHELEQPTTASSSLLWIITLLAATAMVRRLDNGMFAVFLGEGVSSRITRTLLPLVLILPFFREMLRAHLIASGKIPEHAATAAMASTAAVVSVGVLLVIGYYFRRMENEIRELSLRDELTGLYNLRGFHLLANQAFRLAQRSHLPFSVIFVDVDDLKLINDELGHAAGSLVLVETAELLRSNFRETDVVGRVGGDEFAVAGQFDGKSIAEAARRVSDAANEMQHPHSLQPRLSIGYVSADPHRRQTLHDLLALADAAMYDEKRRKKTAQVAS